jgi:glycosyltransferase involved in cell wall biosynthesis
VLERSIWIAWEKHRRTESVSAMLGARLYAFDTRASRWLRYPRFVSRTLGVLAQERPRVLFVQNPSILLTAMAMALRPIFRYRLVVDAHNAGVYAFEEEQKYTAWLLPTLHRHADLTIVTNEIVAGIVRRNGGAAYILPDPLPDLGSPVVRQRAGDRPADGGADARFVVTFICSYAGDEPFREVFLAARRLPDDVVIYVTGNAGKLTAQDRELAGPRVILTGFLSEGDFLARLRDSDLIMDLTTFDDCLVCGAYEATALEVPMVLSDTPALRRHFRDGAVFVANSERDIAEGIMLARSTWLDLKRGVAATRLRLDSEWAQLRTGLEAMLSPE